MRRSFCSQLKNYENYEFINAFFRSIRLHNERDLPRKSTTTLIQGLKHFSANLNLVSSETRRNFLVKKYSQQNVSFSAFLPPLEISSQRSEKREKGSCHVVLCVLGSQFIVVCSVEQFVPPDWHLKETLFLVSQASFFMFMSSLAFAFRQCHWSNFDL